jgi:hypothetical protein
VLCKPLSHLTRCPKGAGEHTCSLGSTFSGRALLVMSNVWCFQSRNDLAEGKCLGCMSGAPGWAVGQRFCPAGCRLQRSNASSCHRFTNASSEMPAPYHEDSCAHSVRNGEQCMVSSVACGCERWQHAPTGTDIHCASFHMHACLPDVQVPDSSLQESTRNSVDASTNTTSILFMKDTNEDFSIVAAGGQQRL